jgi:CMP-2-keto-3-deoxyoctulosonic acid synthetase
MVVSYKVSNTFGTRQQDLSKGESSEQLQILNKNLKINVRKRSELATSVVFEQKLCVLCAFA